MIRLLFVSGMVVIEPYNRKGELCALLSGPKIWPFLTDNESILKSVFCGVD